MHLVSERSWWFQVQSLGVAKRQHWDEVKDWRAAKYDRRAEIRDQASVTGVAWDPWFIKDLRRKVWVIDKITYWD